MAHRSNFNTLYSGSSVLFFTLDSQADHKKMKRLLLVLAACFVVCSVLFYYLFLPLDTSDTTLELVIERGTPLITVANRLQNMEVVTNARALVAYLKLTGGDKKIQAGRFHFNKGEGALSASGKLMKAEPIDLVVTIHEGLTVEQIASRLAEQINIDSAAFVDLCYDSSFVRSTGIEQNSLEGYLFPDTYRFPENSTPELIIRRMVNRFLQVWQSVDGDSAIIARYSKHQILTIASIVEMEATLISERGLIAGVFHNRLRRGYPLGADPTVRYIFRKFDGPLYVSELNVDNPYNTRRFAGIPPGPICSPGRGAIKAAAAPEKTNKLFFVAKWDGTGAHDFSETYREHNRKKLKYRRLNEMRQQKLDRGK